MTSVLHKLIGDPNEKAMKKLAPIRDKINALEDGLQRLNDDQLRAKTDEYKSRLSGKESLNQILPEAFAVVREMARRKLGQRHYDVQLYGGVVLHQGQIAEMKTGEGKTLVATLPTYTTALTGKGVHVVTVNDYLARRDPVWMGPIYHGLGLSVACLQHDSAYMYDPEITDTANGIDYLRPISRAEAYQADITYGTNNEFGFDHLRDNMATEAGQKVQRELHYAIVDEVDNILIDEARTPLIISGPAADPVEHYYTFAKMAPKLREEDDYTIDDRTRAISLTQEGITKMEKLSKVGNLYDPENFHLVHYIENALTAQVMKMRDKDYVIRDGEVVIVDEFTGRLQTGRRWSDGLHQAVEAKEGIKIQRESITYATITLQNYFRMYKKLAGMTGTAATEADEFHKIYGLAVMVIPTNVPMARLEHSDLVFQTQAAKWRVVEEDIVEIHETGRPLLIGTTSIEASEKLSQQLKRRGVPHQVLNAKIHQQEASIIAQAGRIGAVTVSTNMAGRGTDIVLGGSDTDEPGWQEEHDKVVGLGGLHVIGTEHHDARRIDNQLRGRSGRQGDAGSSQFYVSLEDELMQRFGGERIKTIMSWTGFDEDTPIENKIVTKSINNAQVKVEGYHFDVRKHLLDYDNVLNIQREIIYGDRQQALEGEDLRSRFIGMLRKEFRDIVGRFLTSQHADDWNIPGFITELALICEPPPDLADDDKVYGYSQEQILAKLANYAEEIYAAREQEVGVDEMRTLERLLFLRTIDTHWVSHLTDLDNLRTGIGLHGYAQRDPLVMYASEGRRMFEELLARIQSDVVHTMFHVSLNRQPAETGRRNKAAQAAKASPMAAVNKGSQNAATVGAGKIGRNEQCPCGSGKKYKRCHGAAA